MRDKQAEIRTIAFKTKSLEIAGAKGLHDFKASNGYLRGFYARHNIKYKDSHGEGCSVDESTIQQWFSKVIKMMKMSKTRMFTI